MPRGSLCRVPFHPTSSLPGLLLHQGNGPGRPLLPPTAFSIIVRQKSNHLILKDQPDRHLD